MNSWQFDTVQVLMRNRETAQRRYAMRVFVAGAGRGAVGKPLCGSMWPGAPGLREYPGSRSRGHPAFALARARFSSMGWTGLHQTSHRARRA